MKRRQYFFFILLIPLLFSSCLADILNEKFNFKVPFYIKYETNYGTTPSKKNLTDTYTLKTEDIPTLSSGNSYTTFDGWYLDPDFTRKATPGMVIKDNTTLYAKWNDYSIRQYTIYYSSERGDYIYPETVNWGTSLSYYLPTPNYYSNDYYFDGWYLEPDFKTKAEGWMIVESNITLYAKWNEASSPVQYYCLYYYNDVGSDLFTTIMAQNGEYLTEDYFNNDKVQFPIPAGYTFNGWYTDPYNMINDAAYQFINQDYYLYPSISPNLDTPFTVEFYLMDTENNSYEFVRQDQYTRYEYGQTDSFVASYNYRDNPLDLTYQMIFSSDTNDVFGPNCGTINGDGSSVFRQYYYGHNIYPNQFEQMEAGLPNIHEAYNIQFKSDSLSTFSLENIKQIIENAIANNDSPYYKQFDLGLEGTGLTEIPSGIFEAKDYITRIYLPENIEKIGAGAFYGCNYLNYVSFPYNPDPAKKWYYMVNGSAVELDISDASSCADFLKYNYSEIYLQ